MIQIRQKRQNLRNKIRKQYLQNHFKTLRKRLFDFGDDNQSQNTANIKALQNLLTKSQDQNKLVIQIREENLFHELNLLIQAAIEKKDKLEAKYLFTIISNIFRDDINPFEKEELFKISVKLFQSLHLSFIDFQSSDQKKEYKNTLETVSSAVLSYYISTVIIQGQYLQQRDQQFIQKNFYPALLNLLFYSLKHPKLIGSPQQFCKDLQRAIFNIFDMKESSYETGNSYKAKRNEQFFIDIAMNHYFYISEKTDFPEFFQLIEKYLFFLYDKITEYFEQIKYFFNIKEFWMVIEQNFQQQVSKQSSNKMIHIYSIMRTFIDNDYFINEVNQLMLAEDQKLKMSNFEIIMRQLSYNKSKQFQILQFLQGIIIGYQQKNNFKQIIQFYSMKFFEILTNIFLEFDRQSFSDKKQRKILTKSLQIICVFIQKGNQQILIKRNQYVICFEKNYGAKKIQQITDWSEENDLNNNSDLTQILQLVDWLSYQFEFTSSDNQFEI